MNSKFMRGLFWVFAVCLGFMAALFFPSFASLLFALGAFLIVPLPRVQDFLQSRGLHGRWRAWVALAVAFAAILSAPSDAPTAPESDEPPAVTAEAVTRSLPARADAEASPEKPEADAASEDAEAAEAARREEEERQAAEEQARQEEEARQAAEEAARREEEARQAAEEQARREEEERKAAEEKARQEEEARQRAAEEAARREEEERLAAEAARQRAAEQAARDAKASNFDTWNSPENAETTDKYVLNTSSKKIHSPDCRTVPKIAPQNYATSNESIEELESDGYTICGICGARIM